MCRSSVAVGYDPLTTIPERAEVKRTRISYVDKLIIGERLIEFSSSDTHTVCEYIFLNTDVSQRMQLLLTFELVALR